MGQIRPMTFTPQQQKCPACGDSFPCNDGGRHLRGCDLYQQRQADLTADYEDEDGIWWTFNRQESEWVHRA